MSTRCSDVVGTLCVCWEPSILPKTPNEFINLNEPRRASEGAKHFVFDSLGVFICSILLGAVNGGE